MAYKRQDRDGEYETDRGDETVGKSEFDNS